MSIYKPENREATTLAIEPRNWNPVIGMVVVLALLVVLAGMYVIGTGG